MSALEKCLSCPQMKIAGKIIARLTDELDEAREMIQQLRDELRCEAFKDLREPSGLLTRGEQRLAQVLAATGCLSFNRAETVLYPNSEKIPKGFRTNTFKVLICRIRKKLGVEISSTTNLGYSIDAETQKRIEELIYETSDCDHIAARADELDGRRSDHSAVEHGRQPLRRDVHS